MSDRYGGTGRTFGLGIQLPNLGRLAGIARAFSLRLGLLVGGRAGVALVRAAMPRITGELRASIQVTPAGRGALRIGSTAPWARYVRFRRPNVYGVRRVDATVDRWFRREGRRLVNDALRQASRQAQ